MGLTGPFRKWRRNSYASPHSSTIVKQSGKLDLYQNDTSCREILRQITPPPSSSSKKKSIKKQYPPSPDLYLHGIGDYTFIKQIGQGKFSKVLLSCHYLTKEQVAIKVIDKRVHDYGVMSRLAREIALMEILDHPNIVKLHETYETADTLFIVMEYIEGCNLEEYLQKHKGKKISEAEARHLFHQMVNALDHCHSKWVVHRDIKAPNVLLTKDNQVKIADFGLGNRYGRRRLKTICGSKLYYSPEIMNGQGYTGPEIDCWCLGVLLYRMTVGEEPFRRAKTMGELKRDVTTGNFNLPQTLSKELQSTILQCMSIDKSKRSRLCVALKDDLWLSNNPPKLVKNNEAIDDDDTMKARFIKDMEEEMQTTKQFSKTRTIICHQKAPSIYFTSATHSSKPDDMIKNNETLRQLQYQAINHLTSHIKLSKGAKSPIRHLLQKIKPHERSLPSRPAEPMRKASSNISLSQLYQRVAKDQVYYYSYQSQRDEEDVMMRLVQTICNSMGITYHREKRDRLLCILNDAAVPMTYQLKRKDSKLAINNQSSQASFSSTSLLSSQTSRMGKLKRATSHVLSSLFQSSMTMQETLASHPREEHLESFILFSLDVQLVSVDAQTKTVAMKLSKLEGSTKMFRVVCNSMTHNL